MTAQASGWRDRQGHALPESDAAKSHEGFSASVIITSDRDWQAKWNTPRETVPGFRSTKEVALGGELNILTFLANPLVDPNTDMTDVACDLVVERPDGTLSADEHDQPCFKVKLPGDPKNIYLSNATIKFTADATDPLGTWLVRITVKDRLRKVELRLKTFFVYQ